MFPKKWNKTAEHGTAGLSSFLSNGEKDDTPDAELCQYFVKAVGPAVRHGKHIYGGVRQILAKPTQDPFIDLQCIGGLKILLTQG